ncbi:UNVERIFIED_CONTAM: hypothetical protein HHA_451160 [Hammondia hammondi]|eukprot:XP_008883835.1 hypothetical protein HHA_451160 [Hammondia hammondi]
MHRGRRLGEVGEGSSLQEGSGGRGSSVFLLPPRESNFPRVSVEKRRNQKHLCLVLVLEFGDKRLCQRGRERRSDRRTRRAQSELRRGDRL